MNNPLRVFPRHLRACGFCLIPGARDWVKSHGFDWRDFVNNGISAEDALATGDLFAFTAVEAARKEAEHG